MIYDRTIQDVAQAKEIFETKVKNFVALTTAEKTTLERGRVTVNTLNRIEQKQAEMAQKLKNYGYFDGDIINKSWSNEVFFNEDLKRLAQNTATLREAFYIISSDMKNPEARFFYEDFNTMERFLAEIEALIENMEKSFKRSGAVSANQTILPLKGVI